jgi:hypothetical protein
MNSPVHVQRDHSQDLKPPTNYGVPTNRFTAPAEQQPSAQVVPPNGGPAPYMHSQEEPIPPSKTMNYPHMTNMYRPPANGQQQQQ